MRFVHMKTSHLSSIWTFQKLLCTAGITSRYTLALQQAKWSVFIVKFLAGNSGNSWNSTLFQEFPENVAVSRIWDSVTQRSPWAYLRAGSTSIMRPALLLGYNVAFVTHFYKIELEPPMHVFSLDLPMICTSISGITSFAFLKFCMCFLKWKYG